MYTSEVHHAYCFVLFYRGGTMLHSVFFVFVFVFVFTATTLYWAGGGGQLARGARVQADPLKAGRHHNIGHHAQRHAVREGLLPAPGVARGAWRCPAAPPQAGHSFQQETPMIT